MLKKNEKIIKAGIINKINKTNKSIFLGLLLCFLFFLFFIFISSFSAEAASSSWVTINTTGVMINATYNESVSLVGDPKIFNSTNQDVGFKLKTDIFNNGRTFITTTKSPLPAGTYTYIITVSDIVGNIRNDSRVFEIKIAPPPGCGDKIITGSEECDDGNNIDGEGCSAFCKSERCGNGVIDPGELCEGTNLNGMSCTSGSLGRFISGQLKCNSDCKFDKSDCKAAPNFCGNDLIEPGEQCDGGLHGKSCDEFDSFSGGTLKCVNCYYDTSSCKGTTEGYCGDEIIEVGEQCDGGLHSKSCADFDSFTGSDLTCANCKYNTSKCIPPVQSACGDRVLNEKEECDGLDWGNIVHCSSFSDFIEGTLKCNAECEFDTGSCTPREGPALDSSCSDGKLSSGESDVDCGGSCLACADGKKCTKNDDCLSYYCKGGVCAPPSCTDNVKNGLEADVDCGASCPSCAIDKSCNKDSDCVSNFCHQVTRKCSVSSCTDGFQNGDESDVDCGGGCIKKCGPAQKCISGNDCLSARCEAGICTVDRELDTDEDGIPDWWEDKYGLDKNDPNDADENSDKDGCSNLEEYNENTDPTATVPDCGDKNRTLQIILLIIGLLLMLGSIGFLAYYRKVLAPQQKTKSAATVLPKPMTAKTQAQPQAMPQRRLMPSALAQSRGERKTLLRGFDTVKNKTGKEAEAGKGAKAAAAEESGEDFIPLASLGKKPGQPKEQKEEKASQPKQESSATFDKLKALSDSYKKKKESKK